MDYRKRVSPLPTVEDAPPVDSFKQPFDSTEAELPLYLYTKEPKGRCRWQRGAFVALLAICLAMLLLQRYQPHPHLPTQSCTQTRNPAYLIEAEHGAVASENKRCSDIGVTVLKEGGNAVDAAISAVFCVGVVNMFSSGIGGGGFMTVCIPPSSEGGSSEVYTIDFRETAPTLANTVGVPGEVRGLQEAHECWGKLLWTRLVQPSIDLAAGWAVDKELARCLQMFARLMLPKEDWRAIFVPEGLMLLEGETIRRTNYSRTLATIASEGPNVFYKVQATGGIMTNGDLENYTVKVDHTLQGTYQRSDFIGEGRTGLNIHRFIEALKFGFAARTKIGDLAYVTNETARVAEISTKTYADAVALNLTDDRTHTPEYYNPDLWVWVSFACARPSSS
ncbi:nucleophile aminohydrolase [Suillus fuscotomentosus]|uniref:Nucleophile aminohydrolase n=1 Tax=Suillus fuscotomentosus TaxID=1912939 RepID=A0AAD4HI39_9AGAM|nr:nucleophile aminohydrolase [Suillus fuscotomentosus]KAG1896324.1 nucleophile aminohydrolase [Suillus fuscotomentosus]